MLGAKLWKDPWFWSRSCLAACLIFNGLTFNVLRYLNTLWLNISLQNLLTVNTTGQDFLYKVVFQIHWLVLSWWRLSSYGGASEWSVHEEVMPGRSSRRWDLSWKTGFVFEKVWKNIPILCQNDSFIHLLELENLLLQMSCGCVRWWSGVRLGQREG